MLNIGSLPSCFPASRDSARRCVTVPQLPLPPLGKRGKVACPHSLLPTPPSWKEGESRLSPLPTPNSLLLERGRKSPVPTPYSPLPTPNSLLPTPHSLLPTPNSALPLSPNNNLPKERAAARGPAAEEIQTGRGAVEIDVLREGDTGLEVGRAAEKLAAGCGVDSVLRVLRTGCVKCHRVPR